MLAAKDSSRLVVEFDREGRDTECNTFLTGIDVQLARVYAVREVQTVLVELSPDDEEEYITYLELIMVECLDSDARSTCRQALSGVEKDHLIATVRRS
jgi:hypothetical protein